MISTWSNIFPVNLDMFLSIRSTLFVEKSYKLGGIKKTLKKELVLYPLTILNTTAACFKFKAIICPTSSSNVFITAVLYYLDVATTFNWPIP